MSRFLIYAMLAIISVSMVTQDYVLGKKIRVIESKLQQCAEVNHE